VQVRIGDVLLARYQREWQDGAVHVPHGWLGIGAAADDRPPDGLRGVAAHVRVPSADLDAWQGVLAQVFPVASGPGTGMPASAGAPSAAASDSPYAPDAVRLMADELRLFGRKVHAVQASWQPVRDGWRSDFRSREGDGSAHWHHDGTGERLHARLTRLDLGAAGPGEPPAVGAAASVAAPASATAGSSATADAGSSAGPRGLPPTLDLVIDALGWKGRRIGRLELEAAQRTTVAGAREWRVQRVQLTTPEAQLVAQGPWLTDGSQSPSLGVRIEVADTGELLERLGSGGAIRGGRGVVSGEIAWSGSPLVPNLATLRGHLALSLGGGQFLKAEPGAGRLLGVLGLQALPRRLALDFRDVFQEGFAFDAITGDVTVEAGTARTQNLRMRGVQAAVLMEGRADLRAETQDLRVVVVPDINAGTASLAYAAINPAVGLGTFLAQMFLRRPLSEAGTREFHVTGSWADPKVARVERTAPAPLADTVNGQATPGTASPAPDATGATPAIPGAPAPESTR
jgi:uncharacterized protein YhdP